MPNCHVVWGYKLSGTERSDCVVDDELAARCVIVENFNECWAGSADGFDDVMHPGAGSVASECIKARMTVAIIHHENDRKFMGAATDAGIDVVHIPHCADPDFFRSDVIPWQDRKGIILTGVCGDVHYPIRYRWRKLIATGAIEAKIVPRPPNYTESPEESDEYVRSYADAMSRCQVKLGCSSCWKYPLNHYVEAAMSGCAHVADMPDCAPPGFEDMIVQVSVGTPDNILKEAVEYASARSCQLGMRAADAAMQYTTDRYASNFVDAVRKHL